MRDYMLYIKLLPQLLVASFHIIYRNLYNSNFAFTILRSRQYNKLSVMRFTFALTVAMLGSYVQAFPVAGQAVR
jgi:hypothetical protein